MKRVSHMLGGYSLVLQGELSYGVLQELHNHCDDPKPVLPPLPQDKQEVEPAFVLLKSMVAIGRAPLDNLNLPPPVVHAAGDAVILGTALEKFIGGVYNTDCRQRSHWKTSPKLDTSFTSSSFGANRSGIAGTCTLFAQTRRFAHCCLFAVAGQKGVWGTKNFCLPVWQPEGRGRLLPCEDNGDRPQLLGG